MSTFIDTLHHRQSRLSPDGRRLVFVAYDQLHPDLGALATHDPSELHVLLIETTWKPRQRPYHKQKLAFLLTSQRHFALELLDQGIYVDYLFGHDDYAQILRTFLLEHTDGEQPKKPIPDHSPLLVTQPAERELRENLQPLVDDGLLTLVEHTGWLSTPDDFTQSQNHKLPWRMDAFYRHMRRKTGILLDDDQQPLGGKFSHDDDNRQFWPGDPPAPKFPRFDVDPITREVGELIEQKFSDHPGRLHLERIPATCEQVEEFWQFVLQHCMHHFGPFEDAMSSTSRHLFHTLISPLLNLHRLLPRRVVDEVAHLDIPLNSKEGFIRQVLGWREFIRHVHHQTDGFTNLPEDYTENFLDTHNDLPPAYWGAQSGLNCLDTVVESVLDEGYSHHITRLMVLANIAALLDTDPRQVSHWFWVMYVDAYDWVVEPNVLGMGLFALGDLFTTKPYVSGSNYIDKMSDYCADCTFHPSKNCPLKSLYWAFLARHEEKLKPQGRMNLMLGMLRRRSDKNRTLDALTFDAVQELLQAEQPLSPQTLSDVISKKKSATEKSS